MDAGERMIRHLRGIARVPAGEGCHQELLDAAPDLGVVALARNIDENRDETLERIVAHEHANPPALLDAENAEADLEQRVRIDLEQLVARIGFEDVLQGLVVMPVGREARALEHALHLAAQQRNFERAAVIGGRGEEADEAAFANHPAGGLEQLETDDVHRHAAVHGGAHRGLCDEKQARRMHELGDFGRQALRAGIEPHRAHARIA